MKVESSLSILCITFRANISPTKSQTKNCKTKKKFFKCITDKEQIYDHIFFTFTINQIKKLFFVF